MLKRVRRASNLAFIVMIALLGQSCGRDGGVIGTERLPSIKGKFVFEDDKRTQPLSGVLHSIFYEFGDKRVLIFKGYYGGRPKISLLNADTILVSYCGGSIRETTPFIEVGEHEDGLSRLIHVQPVVASGISANGREVCPILQNQ